MLFDDLRQDFEFWGQLAHPEEIEFGVLQPFIQPYRPAWQQTLQLPEATFQEGTYVFKVSLDKDLWREIIMPAQSTLQDLSNAILEAYSFDHDHLYRFLYATRFGNEAEVNHTYRDEGPWVDDVRIGDLPAQPGFSMTYHFDFGDNWMFNVTLERINPPEPGDGPYRIGKRKGKSPEQYPSYDDE